MSEHFQHLVTGPNGHIAPDWFWDLSPEYIKAHSNGCGPQGWKIDLIPDKIAGVDLTDACDQHDVMYGEGKDEEDKRIADLCLLFNGLVEVDKYCASEGFLTHIERMAHRRAIWEYYCAVSDFGHDAFWKNKK